MGYVKQLLNEPSEALDQSDSEEFNSQFITEHSKTSEILREIQLELAQDKDLAFMIHSKKVLTKTGKMNIYEDLYNSLGQKLSCSYAMGLKKLKILSRSDNVLEVFNELTGDCIRFLA